MSLGGARLGDLWIEAYTQRRARCRGPTPLAKQRELRFLGFHGLVAFHLASPQACRDGTQDLYLLTQFMTLGLLLGGGDAGRRHVGADPGELRLRLLGDRVGAPARVRRRCLLKHAQVACAACEQEDEQQQSCIAQKVCCGDRAIAWNI